MAVVKVQMIILSQFLDNSSGNLFRASIIKGEFAVAENGAVWVKEADARHRALYFIAQKLIMVVPKGELVHTMHEAYTRISFNANDTFGLFISGPSKTADIEQSLVIGAHGATEACVMFI